MFPDIEAKVTSRTTRVDGEYRLASPFEHICGGAATHRNESLGNDGPTQYISFSNAGSMPSVAKDCTSPFDKGQRRVKLSVESAKAQKSLIFDFSKQQSAWDWCFSGGAVKTAGGTILRFKGAKNIAPWPYACANRAWQLDTGGSSGTAPNRWWTKQNRKKVARSCVTWASRAAEVLVLPSPDRTLSNEGGNAIKIETERNPAKGTCSNGLQDKCTRYDSASQTVTCANGTPKTHRIKNRGVLGRFFR